MTEEFELCPFCGSRSAKIQSRAIRSQTFVENFGYEYGKRTKYYIRCKKCNARGPLANSESVAREFWNYTKFDLITKSVHFSLLRYK